MCESCEIKTWADFEKFRDDFLEETGEKEPNVAFRGQEDADWKIESSMRRQLKALKVIPDDDTELPETELEKARQRALKLELESMQCFQTVSGHLNKAHPHEWIAWYAVMQHYGGVSRSIDWSRNPKVGLYFAVRGAPDKDGKLFALNLNSLENPVKAEHSKDPDKWFPDYRRKDGKLDFSAYHKALQGNDKRIHWCTMRDNWIRIRTQHGWLLTCMDILLPFEKGMGNDGQPVAFKEAVIPAEAKPKLLAELAIRGIDGSSLFSDTPERAGYRQKELVTILESLQREAEEKKADTSC
ncbi:MAG TPA: hypothetical protein DCX07_04105 [Phycisphaerales bacterium]|nr:hypothetical protein [Phycisphaerales bacterium]